VRYGRFSVISTLAAPRLDRNVRGVLRAAALSEAVRGRPLAVPAAFQVNRQTFVVLNERETYLKSIDLSQAKGGITREGGAARDLCGYRDERGFCVALGRRGRRVHRAAAGPRR
jgi:hypothetical protein